MHYVKPLGVLALLSKVKPDVHSVFLMDADTWFSGVGQAGRRRAAQPEDYFQFAPAAQLIGASSHFESESILINSGLLMIRNRPWARKLMTLWFYSRCGNKDQTALWAMLYRSWSDESAGCLKYDPMNFSTFRRARHFTTMPGQMVVLAACFGARPSFRRIIRWPRARSVLMKPLALPHVLLLPAASIHNAAAEAPPFVAMLLYGSAYEFPYVCHIGPWQGNGSECPPACLDSGCHL